jgi:hypothetical protein
MGSCASAQGVQVDLITSNLHLRTSSSTPTESAPDLTTSAPSEHPLKHSCGSLALPVSKRDAWTILLSDESSFTEEVQLRIQVRFAHSLAMVSGKQSELSARLLRPRRGLAQWRRPPSVRLLSSAARTRWPLTRATLRHPASAHALVH